jgi:hypothetical protein
MKTDEKQCPFCAEIIKSGAIKCKHCGSEIHSEGVFSQEIVDENKSNYFSFGFVFLIIVSGILALTAPTKSEFTEYLTKELFKNAPKELQTNPTIHSVTKGITNLFLDAAVNEKNYLIFKVFNIDMHLIRSFGHNVKDVKFVAIAGQFIPLSSNENDTKEMASKVAKNVNSKSDKTNINCTEPDNQNLIRPVAGYKIQSNERGYFYSAPYQNCLIDKNLFVINQDHVIGYATYAEWTYVMYVNPRTGKDTSGWIKTNFL